MTTGVSFSVTKANVRSTRPDKVVAGTNAPGTGDVEVRVNVGQASNKMQRQDVVAALYLIIEKLLQGKSNTIQNI
jgi:hypothetical protein